MSSNEQDGKFLDSGAIEDIKGIDGVTGIETSYDFKARFKLEGAESDARATIASPGYIELEKLKVLNGKNFDPPSTSGGTDNSKKIVVSSAIGKISKKSPEELVGQKVSFSLFPEKSGGKNVDADGYEIVGVADGEETVFWTVADGLDIPTDVPFAKAKVKVKSSDMMGAVRDAISQKGFSVSSLETVSEINKLFNVANSVLGLFGVITLAVSAIGMFNTMTVALLERTREIGIMRSIGASRMDIFLMFIIESTLMGFCGGLAGIILGVTTSQAGNLIVNALANHFGGRSLDLFTYPAWFLMFILIFSFVIGLLTGIGPAKRASGLDPLEALRSK